MTFSRKAFGVGAVIGGVVIVALIASCQEDPPAAYSEPAATGNVGRSHDLKQGLGFLSRLDEFDASEAHQKILYHLRQWLKKQSADPAWSADPLVKQQGLVSDEQLAPLDFEIYDIQVLQEATWLRDVARTVIQENETPPDLERLIADTAAKLDQDTASDLAQVALLFDWTVRNLLLDLQDDPGDTQRTTSPVILQVWESLLMGRGTVWEKSRVFILLTRQIGLPVVILAVEQDDGSIRPWLPAVLLGDQLFLFDMRLATPVPGADGGIATLAEAMDNPGTLSQLQDQSETAYSIQPADLANVVALIDATPGYLSQRMELLEQQLMGESKTVLTVSPTPLANRLAQCRGIQAVGIWQMPYQAFALRANLISIPDSVRWLASEHRLFDRRTPLAQARLLHFRGRYDPTEDLPGARQYYLECRRPDAQIQAISDMTLDATDDSPTPEQIAAYRQRLEGIENLMMRTKQNASYWLGLIAFDRGEYEAATNYFKKRLIDAYPDSMWTSGAKYNLARCYEAIGVRDHDPASLDRAIKTYQAIKDSPWTPACQLRAHRLDR